MNSLLVGNHISLRVGGGERCFAQHIVGVTEAFLFKLARVGQRLGDGLAGDKLLAHQTHRHVHAFTDKGLAALANNTVERARQAGFVVRRDQTARKQQAPGGGVDKQRRAAANVRLPVAVADFVADQRITRGFIRDTQQRFGKAHQCHAFLRGERKLLQQALHHTGAAGGGFLVAQLLGEAPGKLVGFLGDRLRQTGLLQQHRHRVGFRTTPGGSDGRTADGLRLDLLGEFKERLVSFFHWRWYFIAFVRRARQQRRQLRQAVAVLQLFQIIKDGLFNQPVRRAVDFRRGGFNALAGGVVQLDPHRGGAHALTPVSRSV